MEDRRRRDLLGLAAVAIVVRLPAILAPRHLSFDDGVYGSTALALRDGARPYRDVFSSQGPLHQPLLYGADLLGLRTSVAPRLLSVAAGVVVTLATYLAARVIADRRAALVAALLATTSGSVLLVTTGISGDGPALALAVSALALALATRDRSGLTSALAVGVLVGAACSVKLLVAPILLPVGLVLLAGARRGRVVVAAAAAVAVPLLLAAPWGYGRVWDQSVAYHQEARRYSVGEAAWRIVTTLVERDVVVVVTAAVVLAAALLTRDRWHAPAAPTFARPGLVLGAWLVAQVAVLLVESAMWRPHVSQLVVPLCLLAALRLPGWRTLGVAWLVAVPLWAVGVVGIVRPGGYRGGDARLAATLRGLPDTAVVVTDEPGYAWRAGLRVPDAFVDVSVKQLDQGRITERDVLAAARAPGACAVLVTSDERFGRIDDLPARLASAGYRVVLDDGDHLVLRRPCR